MGSEMSAENPFMLSLSKHVSVFFNSLFAYDFSPRDPRRDRRGPSFSRGRPGPGFDLLTSFAPENRWRT